MFCYACCNRNLGGGGYRVKNSEHGLATSPMHSGSRVAKTQKTNSVKAVHSIFLQLLLYWWWWCYKQVCAYSALSGTEKLQGRSTDGSCMLHCQIIQILLSRKHWYLKTIFEFNHHVRKASLTYSCAQTSKGNFSYFYLKYQHRITVKFDKLLTLCGWRTLKIHRAANSVLRRHVPYGPFFPMRIISLADDFRISFVEINIV